MLPRSSMRYCVLYALAMGMGACGDTGVDASPPAVRVALSVEAAEATDAYVDALYKSCFSIGEEDAAVREDVRRSLQESRLCMKQACRAYIHFLQVDLSLAVPHMNDEEQKTALEGKLAILHQVCRDELDILRQHADRLLLGMDAHLELGKGLPPGSYIMEDKTMPELLDMLLARESGRNECAQILRLYNELIDAGAATVRGLKHAPDSFGVLRQLFAEAEQSWRQHAEALFALMELSSPIGQGSRINRDLSHGQNALYENHCRFCASILGLEMCDELDIAPVEL